MQPINIQFWMKTLEISKLLHEGFYRHAYYIQEKKNVNLNRNRSIKKEEKKNPHRMTC